MKEVEPATLQPMTDRPPPEPELQQLRAADDAVLLPGEPGDDLVRMTFGPDDGSTAAASVTAPMLAPKM